MRHPITLSVIVVCTLAGLLRAEPATQPAENATLWKPRTTSVAVFKNGMGFFIREGEVGLRDGWCVGKEIPPAAFGTLAIFSTAKDQIVDIVGSGPGEVVEFDDADAPRDPAAKRARLEASRNLTVSLTYTQKGADRSAAGKLVSVGPEFVVLENASNSFAVPLDGISKMQVMELPVRVHVQADGNKAPARAKLGMAYLRKGITWVPEYTLKVIDDSTAELTLRGTLVNEAEDIIHADVNFVVGVPHFLHSDYMEPIAVGQAIRTIAASVAPQQVMTQVSISNDFRSDQFQGTDRAVPPGGDVRAALGNLPQLDSAGGSDFTVYTKNDLTVRRGEKAIVTLFVRKIRYTHTYTWTPPGQVQHFLNLQNDTDTPWTTGPILAISGDRPLTEELLKYTPREGVCPIQVTSAVNVATEKNEAEQERKLNAYSPEKDVHYDLVTLKGDLKLRNFEPRPADITVIVNVPGKPMSATDNGAMAGDPNKLLLREREGTITWKLSIKSGETKSLSYTYERYVRSN